MNKIAILFVLVAFVIVFSVFQFTENFVPVSPKDNFAYVTETQSFCPPYKLYTFPK